jgi:Asp-tRNA(Asn)/Glu-tRNA(Gln) amidotransferase A subunit family amidase
MRHYTTQPDVLPGQAQAAAAAKAYEIQTRKETLGPLHGLPVAHKDQMEIPNVMLW